MNSNSMEHVKNNTLVLIQEWGEARLNCFLRYYNLQSHDRVLSQCYE